MPASIDIIPSVIPSPGTAQNFSFIPPHIAAMRWSVQAYGIVDIRNSIWLRRISGPDLTKMAVGEGAFCHFITGADANMAYVMRVS